MKDDLCIIVPAYNEEKTIRNVLLAIKKIIPEKNIIVGNDGSKDRTAEISRSENIILIDEKRNHGKGWITRKACDYAIRKGYKKIILMDADGQHFASDIPKFIKELESKDIVFSYRVGEKQPFIFKIGNKGLNIISKILFGINIKDTQSGFRGFTKEAYERIRWKSDDYAMESEMIARSKGLIYSEIPIKKIYNKEHKGDDKGTTVWTGLRIAWQMMKWRLKGVK